MGFAGKGVLRRGDLSCAPKQRASGAKRLQAWLGGPLNSNYSHFKKPHGPECQFLLIRIDVIWMMLYYSSPRCKWLHSIQPLASICLSCDRYVFHGISKDFVAWLHLAKMVTGNQKCDTGKRSNDECTIEGSVWRSSCGFCRPYQALELEHRPK